MKMKVIIPVMCILSWSVAPAAADEGSGLRLSLKEAQDYAVRFSTETSNARIDVAMAKKKVWETTASGLPQLSATLSYRDNLKIPTTLIPAKFLDPDAAEGEFIGLKFGTQHNATMDVTATQLVFNGSYFVALQASKVYLQLSRDQQEKKEIDIRATVASTYHLILLAEKNRAILRASVDNLRQTWQETDAMYRAGFSEATAVDQLQLSVTDLENILAATERQIDTSYRLLKLQLGLDQDRAVVLSSSLSALRDGIDTSLPATKSFLIARHIDYRILETQEKSMAMLLKSAKAEYLPTVTAYLSLSQAAMREKFNFFNQGDKWYPATVLGFNLSLPVFTSGARSARVAQASFEFEKTRNLKKQMGDRLKLIMNQARSDFSEALEREKNTAQMLILAQRIFENTRYKFGQGMVTSMELTQAHSQYLNAESGHAQAVVQLLDARIQLDKALNQY